MNEEHILIKIVLDIYLHYFEIAEYPVFSTVKIKILPIIFLFYQNLSSKEVEVMFNSIKINRKLFSLMIKEKEKFLLFKNKRSYLREYAKMKEDLIRFTNGNEDKIFH